MDELDVAFAGVLTTGFLGVVGFVTNYLTGRAERRHARQLAQDERLFEKRAAAYEELLTQAHRDMLSMERNYPMLGPAPAAPPEIDDLEWIALRSRILSYGSAEVLKRLDAYMEKVAGFIAVARTSKMMEAQGRQTPPEPYVELEQIRSEARELLKALANQINEELTKTAS
jgi:hypothetical protein